VLEQSGIETIAKGDRIVCDIAPVPKGKLEAIAIHSVQTGSSPEGSESGEVLSIDAQKGYGFVKATNLEEDAFVSERTNNGQLAGQLRLGSKIKGTVAGASVSWPSPPLKESPNFGHTRCWSTVSRPTTVCWRESNGSPEWSGRGHQFR
jgi:cold shock CspA family protein